MDLQALQAVAECPFRWEEALAGAEALAVQECRQWEDQVEAKGNRVKVAKGCRRWEARKEDKARWVKAAKECHHREALAAAASKEVIRP